jgi:hypothetical protein
MLAALKLYDPRDCGDCTACCTHLPIGAGVVSADAKPAGKDCGHLCSQGCGIYELRPKACADFHCAWLNDRDWPEAWRPDESGLLCLREMLEENLPAALVYEIRRDALLLPVANEILTELVRISVVVAVVGIDQSRRLLPGQWRGDLSVSADPASPLRRAA